MSPPRACCCNPPTALKGVWCGTSPVDCDWTTVPPLYFATTTLCAGTGLPIEDGQVVFYRGLCYELTDDFEPPAVMIVEDVDEVECAATCEDSRCSGPWYYQAQVCEGHGPNACVLIEYCDAQDIFAAANVPSEQAVQCITFQAPNGKCYSLLPSGFVGHVPDTTDCDVVSSIGTFYRNCCHCSQQHEDQGCASSERITPGHYSLTTPDCWTGDRQGACCGSRYSMTWQYRHRYEFYGAFGLEIDDTVTHGGTWLIGPPTTSGDCAGMKVMAVACLGSFSRVYVDLFNTYSFDHDIYSNWISAEDIQVQVPFGCWTCVYVARGGGCPCLGGHGTMFPTAWVTHFWLGYGWSFETVNGHTVETDCSYSGVETIGPISISAAWNQKNSTGGGSFAYTHEIHLSGQLSERVTVSATYTRQTIIPCELCKTQTTAPATPDDGESGDSRRAGCGPGCGGGAAETWEVLA